MNDWRLTVANRFGPKSAEEQQADGMKEQTADWARWAHNGVDSERTGEINGQASDHLQPVEGLADETAGLTQPAKLSDWRPTLRARIEKLASIALLIGADGG